jgi:uncharacterized membrane-anchored protein YhcB (DUF1043 family)
LAVELKKTPIALIALIIGVTIGVVVLRSKRQEEEENESQDDTFEEFPGAV